jgi:hypothetical protein
MVTQRAVPFFYQAILVLLLVVSTGSLAQTESETPAAWESATENNEVFLQTTITKDQVYVQEALIYSIKLYYTLAFERGAAFSRLEMSEAAFNKLGEDLNYTEEIDGTLYTVNESRFVIFPQNSGEFSIAPVNFRAFTQTRPTRNNPNLRTTERRQTIELTSGGHQISVLPLPSEFPGANWIPSSEVKISESWSKSLEDMRIGDSVVRTIELTAAGIYASMLSNLDFTLDSSLRSYPAEAQQVDITENTGARSIHTQNITLVATEAGDFTIPAIEIPWWNTSTDTLEFARLPSQELSILTVDGKRLEVEPEAADENASTNYFLSSINLNLLLVIGVIFLLSALFFGPALLLVWRKTEKYIANELLQKKNQKHQPTRKLPELNQSLQKLKLACEQKNIKDTADSFLMWGQAYFKNSSFYSIEKINEKLNHSELQSLLQELQTCLYANSENNNFDFESFLQIVTALHKDRKSRTAKALPYHLPPLYKN